MPVPRSEYLSSAWRDGLFEGRVAFVTGGAGTICSAQTRALVALGANACIIGRNVEKTEKAAKDIATARPGAKVLGIGGVDVRSFESLNAAAERCVKELGGIDYVIAGAAGNFVAPISGLSSNAFKSVIDIDVLGTFNTVKATIQHLVASAQRNPNPPPSGSMATGGRIIGISAAFHYTGLPLQAHVSAAKAGVDSIMASTALEYGPLGVTANVLTPGAIAGTEGMARLTSTAADENMKLGVPSGRWGTIKDITDATVFLFSDAANYVNGTTLVVDGALWRRQSSLGVGLDQDMRYPHYLIKGIVSKNVKTGREGKDTNAEKPKL